MTYDEVISMVDVSKTPDSYAYKADVWEADISSFGMFGMYVTDDEEFSKRMHKHWILSWVCTDTRVGMAVYVLDGTPVAISQQSARKNGEEIMFINITCREAVRAAVFEAFKRQIEEDDNERELNRNCLISDVFIDRAAHKYGQ